MTRFELAALLSNRLYMLTDSEKHSIIDKYVTEVNMKIEEGADESAAVAELGDIDMLADRILARHHIDISRISPQQAANTKNAAVKSESDAEENTFFKDAAEKAGEAIKTTAENAANSAKNAAEKMGNTVKNSAEAAGAATKKAAASAGKFAKLLGRSTSKITFTIANLLLFVIVWLPCMALSALAVVFTAAAITVHLFTGIGFWGVDIASAGCCIVGISFCIWLGNIITGGKEHEKNN